jgi:hypothetical protein
MSTLEDYAKQPREQRVHHLTRTGDALAAAIKGQSDRRSHPTTRRQELGGQRRSCATWRDTEEIFGARMEQIVAMEVDRSSS